MDRRTNGEPNSVEPNGKINSSDIDDDKSESYLASELTPIRSSKSNEYYRSSHDERSLWIQFSAQRETNTMIDFSDRGKNDQTSKMKSLINMIVEYQKLLLSSSLLIKRLDTSRHKENTGSRKEGSKSNNLEK